MVEGVILKTIDYQEHSKLVYLYTPSGKISALARGVKKLNSPLRHAIQTGTLASFDLSKGSLPTIKDVQHLHHYTHVRHDLLKTTVRSVVNEIIYVTVTESDNHEKLFPFIKKFYQALDTTPYETELLMVFEMKMLAFLGYFINFNQCNQCQKTTDLWMSLPYGTVFCKHHLQESSALAEKHFTPLKYYLHVDINAFETQALKTEQIKKLYKIIDELYETHLALKVKAKSIMNTLLEVTE